MALTVNELKTALFDRVQQAINNFYPTANGITDESVSGLKAWQTTVRRRFFRGGMEIKAPADTGLYSVPVSFRVPHTVGLLYGLVLDTRNLNKAYNHNGSTQYNAMLKLAANGHLLSLKPTIVKLRQAVFVPETENPNSIEGITHLLMQYAHALNINISVSDEMNLSIKAPETDLTQITLETNDQRAITVYNALLHQLDAPLLTPQDAGGGWLSETHSSTFDVNILRDKLGIGGQFLQAAGFNIEGSAADEVQQPDAPPARECFYAKKQALSSMLFTPGLARSNDSIDPHNQLPHTSG